MLFRSKFAVGDFVVAPTGWQAYGVSNGVGVRKVDPSRVPLSAYLGVAGMPGVTAWVGLNEHGRPKPGETVVVSAASGAVGSAVGQLAKFKGCRAVGIAGGRAKCDDVVNTLGFDACVDYKAADFAAALAAACPKGIDVYFDNVGGPVLDTVLPLGVQTAELCFFNRHGQLIWREPRGLAAGYPVPQLSVHRGRLHMALLAEARARLGADRVRTGHVLREFDDGYDGRVHIELLDRHSDTIVSDEGDALIGADGIHSTVRAAFYPSEGAPSWQGNVLWRAITRWPAFLTGRSMFMAGHRPHKFVAYPLTEPDAAGMVTVNWIAELDRTAIGLARREDWNRQGVLDDFLQTAIRMP